MPAVRVSVPSMSKTTSMARGYTRLHVLTPARGRLYIHPYARTHGHESPHSARLREAARRAAAPREGPRARRRDGLDDPALRPHRAGLARRALREAPARPEERLRPARPHAAGQDPRDPRRVP